MTYDEAGFAIEGELFVRKFYVVCLGYARVEGAWELELREVTCRCTGDVADVAEYGLNEDEERIVSEGEPPEPLLQAEPWIRAKGVSNIPRLLEQLRNKAQSDLRDVETPENGGAALKWSCRRNVSHIYEEIDQEREFA